MRSNLFSFQSPQKKKVSFESKRMLTKSSVHVMWFYLLPKYFPMTEVYFSNVEFLWESSETERVASLQNVGLFQNCNDV